MPESQDNAVEIVGTSIQGDSRVLILMRGQPGMIAVAAYAGDKPITVIVSAAELRAALDRLVSA